MEDDDREFRLFSRYLSLSNALQGTFVLLILLSLLGLLSFQISEIVSSIIMVPLLGADLILTCMFLKRFATALGSSLTTSILGGYVVSSFLSRVMALLYNISVIDNLTIVSVVFAISGIWYGVLLLKIIGDNSFIHFEKLKLLAFANLTGFTVIFGDFFRFIYIGIKILLPIPAAFVYFVLSFDFGTDNPLTDLEEELGLIDDSDDEGDNNSDYLQEELDDDIDA